MNKSKCFGGAFQKRILIISILFGIFLFIGISFAIWQITLQQESTNVITTGCFKIEFQDKNPIELENVYPITDNEGMSLTPYEFTVTNTCESYASFQINLEILNDTTLENLDYVKIMLDEKPNILTENNETTKTLENATKSFKLKTGYLRENGEKTFLLRLWMDEDTPTKEEFMNKTFLSKVTVIATFKENLDNNIETIGVSQNESFSSFETFQIHVTSENYDIVSMSEDLETWEELETKGKDITIEKTVNQNGIYTYYFQDEAENIQDVSVTATNIDDKKPIANMEVTKTNNVISINASSSIDNETSVAKYYYSRNGNNYIESLENTFTFPLYDYGIATTMIGNYKNQKVYLKVEDEVGNVSDVKGYSLNIDDLLYDETVDNNLRYVGASPNNYVWIGETYKTDIYDLYTIENIPFGFSFKTKSECEIFKINQEIASNVTCMQSKNSGDKILWRVIGSFNNIKFSLSDTNGSTRIKLIRDDSIGSYSWDSSSSGANGGTGVNEWSDSDIKTVLNDYYYNSKSNQICYNGRNNATISCDFSDIGLSDYAKTFFDEVVWNTGSNENLDWNGILAITTSKFYEYERSNNTGKICTSGAGCNDNVTRTIKWVGKVGLIYPSDFGYAVGGGSDNRSSCLSFSLNNWSTKLACSQNNWLYFDSEWTMMPMAYDSTAALAYAIYSGSVGYGDTYFSFDKNHGSFIRPTLYLKPEVKITNGDGSIETPFELSLD